MKPVAQEISDREVVHTREFAHPRRTVFEAFSDPRQLAQWWGPHGFTNTVHEFDLRPGGTFRLTMHGADGANYDLVRRFEEVTPPEKVSMRHLQEGHEFLHTMIFTEKEGRTTVTFSLRFDSPAEFARVREFIIPANEQNLDRLGEHLGRQPK